MMIACVFSLALVVASAVPHAGPTLSTLMKIKKKTDL